MKEKSITAAFLTVMLSGLVSAGTGSQVAAILAEIICDLFKAVAQIAGGLAFFMIVWAGIKYIYGRDDPGEMKQAKDMIKYVLIGLVFIVTAQAIVGVILQVSTVC